MQKLMYLFFPLDPAQRIPEQIFPGGGGPINARDPSVMTAANGELRRELP